MKKAAVLLMVSLLLVLAACAGPSAMQSKYDEIILHQHVFKGESESWTGTLKVDARQIFFMKGDTLSHDVEGESDLEVSFIGDASMLAAAKQIKIECLNQSLCLTSEGGLTDETYRLNPGNARMANADDIIEVTVTVDGVSETILLKAE